MACTVSSVPELSPEAQGLLSVAPDEFVAERRRVARELRAAGRPEDARTVESLRKPPNVVLAVNRAARGSPRAARDAAEAAVQLRRAQVAGDHDAYRKAASELDASLARLADVALAHLPGRGGNPSDAMRKRVSDLLRAAVADESGRGALVAGSLTDELEPPGFEVFAGLAPPSRRTARPTAASRRAEEKRRDRERALRAELERAEQALREAGKEVERALVARDRAERHVAGVRAKLDRLH